MMVVKKYEAQKQCIIQTVIDRKQNRSLDRGGYRAELSKGTVLRL